MNSQNVILTVGVVFELIGVALTGIGLRNTWRDHSTGGKLLHAMARELRALLHRRRPVRVQAAGGAASGAYSFMGHATVSLPPDETTEEKVARLKKEVDRVSLVASQAQSAAALAIREIRRVESDANARFNDVRSEVTEKLREHTLDGLPVAVAGLAVAFLGTVIQWVSAVFFQ